MRVTVIDVERTDLPETPHIIVAHALTTFSRGLCVQIVGQVTQQGFHEGVAWNAAIVSPILRLVEFDHIRPTRPGHVEIVMCREASADFMRQPGQQLTFTISGHSVLQLSSDRTVEATELSQHDSALHFLFLGSLQSLAVSSDATVRNAGSSEGGLSPFLNPADKWSAVWLLIASCLPAPRVRLGEQIITLGTTDHTVAKRIPFPQHPAPASAASMKRKPSDQVPGTEERHRLNLLSRMDIAGSSDTAQQASDAAAALAALAHGDVQMADNSAFDA
ncbi:hypothetical protein WJX72_008199 [[Myrmecia] bisecta]|uniref:Uncharacterized protein n=1 Tax=[Myrmecia] bisecta TaxID=41462 RepID=A0AAW1P4Q3_9CHLO